MMKIGKLEFYHCDESMWGERGIRFGKLDVYFSWNDDVAVYRLTWPGGWQVSFFGLGIAWNEAAITPDVEVKWQAENERVIDELKSHD
jgi:hypothetical protein